MSSELRAGEGCGEAGIERENPSSGFGQGD